MDSANGQIHYRTDGAGETVVLFHQSPTSSHEYDAVIPLLAAEYRVIAWDMPGRGASYDPTSEFEIEDFASEMVVLLDALDVERAHLVGHHDGAITAVEVAAMEPGRFDRIVLNGCAAWNDRFAERRAASKAKSEGDAKPAEPPPDRKLLESTWDGYAAWSVPDAKPEQVFPTVLLALQSKSRPQFPNMVPLYLPKIQDRMDLIQGPVLLTAGVNDVYYVEEIEATGKRFPTWDTSVVDGYGNFPGAENPAAFGKTVLDFLRE